ncbi:hypothetical protein B1790_06020 [Mycobacterium sp. AT1]|nr:hypothetical protein B1790_06020 [Mycobacterium sp. AT1]
MDDVMTTQPSILVVDDAPRRMNLLEDLQQIRRHEGLPFRIIAVCWPHQREELAISLASALEMQVLPLIRQDVAKIIRDAGITRESLVGRILDQAKGRPAWASRLIDLIKGGVEWREVQTGEAIRGEISRYLIRAGISKEARDVLAAIAILGTAAESDIASVSSQLEISRTTVRHLIDDLAVGGLLDVRQQWTPQANRENVYGVEPQILATSIVVDAFFGPRPAVVPLAELFEAWPSKQDSITLHCIRAALLGVNGAYPVARSLFSAMSNQGVIGVGSDIYRHYLHLGANEAHEVIERALIEWERSNNDTQLRRQAILDQVATYFADAIRDMDLYSVVDDVMSFASKVGDQGLKKRLLAGFIDQIRNIAIPDGSINLAPLLRIWQQVSDWIAGEPSADTASLRTTLLCELLNPAFESNTLSPEDRRLLRLFSVVLPAESMAMFNDQIWSSYSSTASNPDHGELTQLTALFRQWALIARGFSPGFGREISQEQMGEAKLLAGALADYIMANSNDFPGIRATVRTFSKELGREFTERDPLLAAIFLVSDEGADWHARKSASERALQREVQRGMVQPQEFMSRLVDIRRHMSDWDHHLGSPMFTLFRIIAQTGSDALPLARIAVENKMFPEAGPLITAALAQSDVDSETLTAWLDETSSVRQFVVGYALASTINPYVDRVLPHLTPHDVGDLLAPVVTDESAVAIASRLIEHENQAVRASYASALILSTDGSLDSAIPSDMVPRVLEALKSVVVAELPHGRHSSYFLDRLISSYPAIYEHLFENAMGLPSNADIYKALQPFEDTAPMLGAAAKSRLFLSCGEGTRERRHVLAVLSGNDIAWLESLLEGNHVEVEQVETLFNGLGSPVPIEALARLLAPRGVSPLSIAVRVELGSQWGEEHERVQGYLEQMLLLAESDDRDVAAVGSAGVRHYEPRLEEARARFREAQVRGDL